MTDRLIVNGLLVDPAESIEASRDLLLHDGRIAAIDLPGAFGRMDGAERIDAAGCVVAPGLIDVHVHLREPGQTEKETIRSGTRAAAAGGFTTVVAMPNTLPVTDSVETLKWVLAPERGAAVRVLAMPAVTCGSLGLELTDLPALAAAGAVGFTDDGKPVLGDRIMRSALVAAARVGRPLSQHAEDTRLSNGSSGVNAGALAFRLGLSGMPVEAETAIVRRDLGLLREIERSEALRPRLHVQHVSTAAAIDLIRQAKRDGLNVTCEATPHHFTLTEAAVEGYDTHAKMNPPLRREADRLAVIEGLRDGTIDMIATDHAPHASHEKEVEFARAPNGITGLETALGLALRVLGQRGGLPLARIVAAMTSNPAALLRRGDASPAGEQAPNTLPDTLPGTVPELPLGTLRVGSAADVVIFDPGAVWRYDPGRSLSRSGNTPFAGAAMLGRVQATLFGGEVVFRQPDAIRN